MPAGPSGRGRPDSLLFATSGLVSEPGFAGMIEWGGACPGAAEDPGFRAVAAGARVVWMVGVNVRGRPFHRDGFSIGDVNCIRGDAFNTLATERDVVHEVHGA